MASKHQPTIAVRTRAAQLLRENLLLKILEHLPIALFAKDVQDDYKWIMWNRRAEEIFGIPATAALGRTDFDFFPRPQAEFFRRIDRQVMESGEVVDVPEEPVTSGNRNWFGHTVKVPIYDEDGTPTILFGLIEDITLQKEAQANLEAKVAAERANQAKSEFLAHMSHELRTPLNSLLGIAELFKATRLDGPQRKMLDAMGQAGDLLLKTVDDILDFSKIEAGQVVLEHIGFDLKTVFVQAMQVLQPIASKKNLVLMLDWQGGEPPPVKGDPMRLSRVLHNLIGNAIKYTPRGSIRVLVKWSLSDAANLTLACRVVDTGIGIAPDKHETIFDRFSQADSSTTRKFGGTGLGLAITRELVQMMGGKIDVESNQGEGTTFSFTLPFPRTDRVDQEWAGDTELPPLGERIPPGQIRLLVAEDNALNQLYMEKLLDAFGFAHIRYVQDGQAAIDAFRAEPFDAIFMDCHMPEKNGYEATAEIRALEKESGRHILIVAMTANAMAGERQKCLDSGMDDYVSKPVSVDRFRQVLGRWVALPGPVPEAHEPIAPTAPVDMTDIRNFSGGNREKEQFIVRIFHDQATQVLSTLESQCKTDRSISWRDAAHLLKGSAASIGAPELHRLCARAQEAYTSAYEIRRQLVTDIRLEVERIFTFFAEMELMPAA